MENTRKIIHIDMDAFYASVEQRDNPSLRGIPIAVGGDMARGVISAASYEARKLGVRSAMSSVTAKCRCPQLIFTPVNMSKYKEISQQIRSIFYEYTDIVEPLSFDEAFLDVTHTKKGKPSATLIANEIRERIFSETQLTASAGISYCKFLAKVASNINKPNGIFVITPNQAQDFLKQLEIKDFFGIGVKTAERLSKQGVHYGKDLLRMRKEDLVLQFGKSGAYYFDIVRGIDNREVQALRKRKSIGAEQTFSKDYRSLSIIKDKLDIILDELYNRLEKNKTTGRTITLKLKFEDFSQITRSKTLLSVYNDKEHIKQTIIELLDNETPFKKGIRLIGVALSNFPNDNVDKEAIQLVFDF